MSYRLIVAGGKDFTDYELMRKTLDAKLQNRQDEIIIVSAGCRGADKLGERYANERGYRIDRHRADWKRGVKRAVQGVNRSMGDNADALVAFWDGKSFGTEDMISYAFDKGLPVEVIFYGFKRV
jgi:hypothetical protein